MPLHFDRLLPERVGDHALIATSPRCTAAHKASEQVRCALPSLASRWEMSCHPKHHRGFWENHSIRLPKYALAYFVERCELSHTRTSCLTGGGRPATWSKPSRWSRRLLKRFYPKQTSNISEVAITGRANRPRSNPRTGEILRPHECQGGEVASPVAALAPCCLPIRNALNQNHTIRTTSSPYSPSLS